MLVGDILNHQWKILHTRYWQHLLKLARLDHMNTQAQIISAIYESMFPCLRKLSGQYILGEVFLYSDCDIYDTQTTSNPIRYIAPILLFVSENWQPSWVLHFEALGAPKLQFTHKNWLSTLKKCKMHVSHKLNPQFICLAMVQSLQNGGRLEFGILKATIHSKCEIHIINQPRTLKIYKRHAFH